MQAKVILKLIELKSKPTERGDKEEEIDKNIHKPSSIERKEALKRNNIKIHK